MTYHVRKQRWSECLSVLRDKVILFVKVNEFILILYVDLISYETRFIL